jgi:DNA-directed RNA polymerase specialized sigma24 family protein
MFDVPRMITDPAPAAQGKTRWALLIEVMPELHALVRGLASRGDDVQEILQEVSLRILTGDAPSDPALFRRWSRAVARRVAAGGYADDV